MSVSVSNRCSGVHRSATHVTQLDGLIIMGCELLSERLGSDTSCSPPTERDSGGTAARCWPGGRGRGGRGASITVGLLYTLL